jgi:hypothetical protein
MIIIMPVLPHELIIQVAESNLSAAVSLMVAECISMKEFARICNAHERTDFEEHWSFLKSISKLRDEGPWREMARLARLENIEFSWLVLDKRSCWTCQHWASKARYQLALRGILSCQRDREAVALRPHYEDINSLQHDEYLCNEFRCYRANIVTCYIRDEGK